MTSDLPAYCYADAQIANARPESIDPARRDSEPNELPDCSTPQTHHNNHVWERQTNSARHYPLIDNIILYEQKIEILTGKRSEGLYH